MADHTLVRIETKGHVGIVTLTSPKQMIVLSSGMLRELGEVFAEKRADRSLRAIVLTGEGKAFAAGADIRELQTLTSETAKEFSRLGNEVFTAIETFPVPVIAAVNGFALGGGLELALCADFIYASTTARFGLPETTLGVVPGFGGCRRLSTRIGMQHAKELAYSGRIVDADDALRLGIVNRLIPHDDLMPAAVAVALEIAGASPNAVRKVKRLLNACGGRTADEVREMEYETFGSVIAHPDAAAGIAAFIAKTKPAWRDDR